MLILTVMIHKYLIMVSSLGLCLVPYNHKPFYLQVVLYDQSSQYLIYNIIKVAHIFKS
ncbi:hypothetical protein PROFFT_A_06030 [Candidatus Profftia tarda]|uniref:Uncharacterized protein n=1 Tax=Candidatus Profftia tarda TaxID=1177216 RepID=A0A8E4F0X9_9ENTR|nr:hypothetical protein PROFFT_A_06030 [Candidatus Profftia tarda]